jgi:hypothetical protein
MPFTSQEKLKESAPDNEAQEEVPSGPNSRHTTTRREKNSCQ